MFKMSHRRAATILVQETPRAVVKETPFLRCTEPHSPLIEHPDEAVDDESAAKRLSFGKENHTPGNLKACTELLWSKAGIHAGENTPTAALSSRTSPATARLGSVTSRLRTQASRLNDTSSIAISARAGLPLPEEPQRGLPSSEMRTSSAASPIESPAPSQPRQLQSPLKEDLSSPELAVFRLLVLKNPAAPVTAERRKTVSFADAETQPPSGIAGECVADCCDCDFPACAALQPSLAAGAETQPPSGTAGECVVDCCDCPACAALRPALAVDAETQPPSDTAGECVADCCDCCDCPACAALRPALAVDAETQPPSLRAAPNEASIEEHVLVSAAAGVQSLRPAVVSAPNVSAASELSLASTGDVVGSSQEMPRGSLQQQSLQDAAAANARMDAKNAERILEIKTAIKSDFDVQLQHRDAKIDVSARAASGCDFGLSDIRTTHATCKSFINFHPR